MWHVTELGTGNVGLDDQGFSLTLPHGDGRTYHDAQISDYERRADFANAPPLRLSLRARAEGKIRGTAGFGFWNHAFVPGQRFFRLPQAIWFFFASQPSELALAKGIASHGWKAAAFNARDWRFFALLPFAPLGFLLMRNATLYNALWPIGQRAIGVHEAQLDASLLDEFHTYSIEWRPDGAIFAVDGEIALSAPHVTCGPLGFIAWIDNQYAIVTPQGKFGWGLLDVTQAQSLHLRDLEITSLS